MKTIIKIPIYIIAGLTLWFIIMHIFTPSKSHQKLGYWGMKLGYFDFAVMQYSESIHLNANNAKSFNGRGVVRYFQDQYNHAINDYNRAIDLDPQYALAMKNRGLALLAIGEEELATQDYSNACKLGSCENLEEFCLKLQLRCEAGECLSFETAVKIGLCLEN